MNGTRKEKQIALTVKVKWLSVWENRDILLSQVVLLLDKVYQQCQLKFCLDVEIGVRQFFYRGRKSFHWLAWINRLKKIGFTRNMSKHIMALRLIWQVSLWREGDLAQRMDFFQGLWLDKIPVNFQFTNHKPRHFFLGLVGEIIVGLGWVVLWTTRWVKEGSLCNTIICHRTSSGGH